jgi:hypothetical protein
MTHPTHRVSLDTRVWLNFGKKISARADGHPSPADGVVTVVNPPLALPGCERVGERTCGTGQLLSLALDGESLESNRLGSAGVR